MTKHDFNGERRTIQINHRIGLQFTAPPVLSATSGVISFNCGEFATRFLLHQRRGRMLSFRYSIIRAARVRVSSELRIIAFSGGFIGCHTDGVISS